MRFALEVSKLIGGQITKHTNYTKGECREHSLEGHQLSPGPCSRTFQTDQRENHETHELHERGNREHSLEGHQLSPGACRRTFQTDQTANHETHELHERGRQMIIIS